MKIFKVFLASSGTLEEERKAIRLFVGAENNRLIKQGIFIELVVWEELLKNFSAKRKQDDFNRAMLECDMVIALFFDRVGKFTLEEFNKAYENMKLGNNPKHLLVYFKEASVNISEIKPEELSKRIELQEKIKAFEQIHDTYRTIDELILKIEHVLGDILQKDSLTEDGVDRQFVGNTYRKVTLCSLRELTYYEKTWRI